MNRLCPCTFAGGWKFLMCVVLGLSGAVQANQSESIHRPSSPLQIPVAGTPPVITPDGDGYLDRVLNTLFDRAGLEFNLINTPPRRGLADTESGVADASIAPFLDLGAAFTHLIVVPEPVMSIEYSGQYLRDGIVIGSEEDFEKYRVAYVRGWREAERLFANHERVEVARDPRLLMKMLAENRVDVVFFKTSLGPHVAREVGIDKLKISELRIRQHMYIHLNERHAELVPLLERVLEAMKEDGTFDAIYENY